MTVCPAPFHKLPIDDSGRTVGLALGGAWTDIPTFLVVIFVQYNVVVLHRIQDTGPVDSGQVAELIILLDADRAPGDVHEVIKPQLLQVDHLEDNQGIVEEETGASDDCEIWEEVFQTFQTIDTEEKQVICDHDEFGETEVSEIFGSGLEHQEDLQMALND
jgi:hypothetical protein